MLPEFDNTEIAFQYRSNKELKKARFLFSSMSSPFLTTVGMKLTQFAISLNLPINSIIKNSIFKQFCGGETINEAAETATMLTKYGVGIILDYGVEGKEGEAEFDKAVPEFIKAIKYASSQKNIPFISIKITGFARFALLEKIHAKQTLAESETAEWHRVRQRIYDICGAAAKYHVMVLIDAEESWIQQPVDDLAEAMMEAFNTDSDLVVFNTFQLYRHDSYIFLQQAFKKSSEKNYLFGAKLVRGAYMEKENKRAQLLNYSTPIQPDKESTDKDYDAALIFCLERLDKIALFIGTHNERSCLLAAAYMHKHDIRANHPHVYFSQLYGMSDNISFNLAHSGYNVAKYLPYGPVKDVVPYLMRRAQENTSVKGQTGRELLLINKEIKRRKLQ